MNLNEMLKLPQDLIIYLTNEKEFLLSSRRKVWTLEFTIIKLVRTWAYR
jgi:hypothetical protein